MSISNALHNALTGLVATGRGADVVASNIANARSEGYGVRRLETTTMLGTTYGAGVRVVGVQRVSDPVLIGQRREADAAEASAAGLSGFYQRLEGLIGMPDDPASLSGRFDALEAALTAAATRPDSQSRLVAVLNEAQQLVHKVNAISEGIQDTRREADAEIARQVEKVNTSLEQIAQLNAQIRAYQGGGRDTSSMLDHQQRLIDDLSGLMPIRELRDAAGLAALYTADGITLLDGVPSRFGFSSTPVIAPDMTVQNGGLATLTVNGRVLNMGGDFPAMPGGALSTLFMLRDKIAPEAQAQLDAVARDLTTRFDAPSIDPARPATLPGLFTDASSLAIPANEVGLAGRLRVNALADPAQGGAAWHIRDGFAATSEGAAGNAAILTAMLSAMQDERVTATGGFSGAARSLSDLGGDYLSIVGIARQTADTENSFASSRRNILREAELRTRVDTDAEMQELLLIEQAYAANAKLIQTAEDMLDQLMRIGS